MLQASTDYNIDFVYRKKESELIFCSRLKKYILMVSPLTFIFKIIRPINFSAVKKLFHKQRFILDQGSFLQFFSQTRKFLTNKSPSLIKEINHKQRFFLNQRRFPQSKIFLQTKIKKVFYKSRF